MVERILIAGSGGQGVVMIGKMLGTVAMHNFPYVTFFPSYGIEVRGGAARCEVVFSSEEIASPISERFDTMILMNGASVKLFLPLAHTETLLLVNGSLCSEPLPERACVVPATELADGLGDTRAANLVMLGAYLRAKPFLPVQDVESEIERFFEKKETALAKLNLKAFQVGLTCGKAHETSSLLSVKNFA